MTIATIPIFFGGNGAASSNGPVASAATMTFATETAHIDQMAIASGSGGGVIRKAHLEVFGVSNSGSTTTAWTLSLAINGGTAGTYTKTGQAIGGSGNFYSFRVDGDFTAWLAANWPATTASCSIVATATLTGSAIINCSAILWVTVEWDAASCPNVTKYVPLLIGSHDGATVATGSFTTIATVPQLTGLSSGTFRLAESGLTMRQAKLEVAGDSGGLMTGASLGTPIIRIGGATSYTFASETTSGAGTSRYERFFVDAPATSGSGTVEMRTTAGNASYPFLYSGQQTIAHYVYSYAVASATHVTVAAYHHVGSGGAGFGSPGYATEDDAVSFRARVHVPEASIDAQGPMGWRLDVGDSDHLAMNLRGYQLAADGSVTATKTAQTYERVRHSDSGDNARYAHRVDAAVGAGGASALAVGFNYFRLAAWASSTAAFAGGETYRRGIQASALFHYAYVAPVTAAGPTAATRIVLTNLYPFNQINTPSGEARFAYSSRATATERDVPPVPTTGAFHQNLGLLLHQVQNTTAIAIVVDAKQAGFPFVNVYSGHPYGGFATVRTETIIDLTRYYLQYPAQPAVTDGGWSPPVDLAVQLVCGNAARPSWDWHDALHEIVRTVTVSIVGYTGDGSGIAVNVYDDATKELVAELTTGVGGSATFEWPDAVDALYATAAQGGVPGASLASTGSTLTIEFGGANKGVGSKFNGGFN